MTDREEVQIINNNPDPLAWKRSHAYKRGVESNIPECCIEFYIKEWYKSEVFESHRRALDMVGVVHYIACPDCLRKKNFQCLRLDNGSTWIPLIYGWVYRDKNTGLCGILKALSPEDSKIILCVFIDTALVEFRLDWDMFLHTFEIYRKG